MPQVRAAAAALLLLLAHIPGMSAAQAPVKTQPFSLRAALRQPVLFQPNRSICWTNPLDWGGISSTIGTCFWPAGTPNQYFFNGGLQVVGIVGAETAAWAGDTSGAFFFDPKGTTENGDALTRVYLSSNPRDVDEWPREGRIEAGAMSLFSGDRAGQVNGSHLDAWSLAWEGNSGNRFGRAHPLGLMVETRLFGWGYPVGNDATQYTSYTIYNITATEPAVYANVRPEMRARVIEMGRRFHRGADSAFGVSLPAGGYTIRSLFVGMGRDADVGSAAANFASVNLPLALPFAYDRSFSRTAGWKFDPLDHGTPFFQGAGFAGTKVLRGANGGRAVHFYSNTVGGSGAGIVGDAQSVPQLYRYLSGTLQPATGDQPCNYGNALVTHICYIKSDAPADIRDLFSTVGDSLRPGEFTTFVVANIFAAPVSGCGGLCSVSPGNPLRLIDPVLLAAGANKVDSLAGFRGYADLNNDGVVQGGEIRAVPRSLLGKAQVAQVLFDNKFLLPAAPEAPQSFVIPGNNQVTVLWRPSASETAGDPYFALAREPRINGVEVNPLYDPNYRQFDVEGYRVYRSRTADFRDATLLAQFDYAGTTIRDYTGRINPIDSCAPELGGRTGCPALDSLVPGEPLAGFATIGIVTPLVQLRDGDRVPLPDGRFWEIAADTLGAKSGRSCLCDTGVPFQFVDSTARNGLTYYYAVTAFDVNSLQSGPSSMESPRVPRLVRPVLPPTNFSTESQISITLEGRGQVLDTGRALPTIDPATGRFSGPFPPANGWAVSFTSFIAQLYPGVREARIRLDSITPGQMIYIQEGEVPTRYHLSVVADGATQSVILPVQQSRYSSVAPVPGRGTAALALFRTDSAADGVFGGVPVQGMLELTLPSAAYSGYWSMLDQLNGSSIRYNGARWFDGPSPQRNEVIADPTAANCTIQIGPCGSFGFNNGGSLTGVGTVYQPLLWLMVPAGYIRITTSSASVRRAADYNVYWGGAGRIDSVVDITHNVPVPFARTAGATWGVLNTTAQGDGGHDQRPAVLTPTDWGCVEPFRSHINAYSGTLPCSSIAPFPLEPRAELGQIAFAAGDLNSTTQPYSPRNPANISPQPGFALYVAGVISQFALTSLPDSGGVWSLRDYMGVIRNGMAAGPYQFTPAERPLNAAGVEIVIRSQVNNIARAAADRDLRAVHTVPDPYYAESGPVDREELRFVNLPARATIRIYSASGVLLRLLNHEASQPSGEQRWDLRNRAGQRVASGVYFYHVESGEARRVGRMTIVNYTD